MRSGISGVAIVAFSCARSSSTETPPPPVPAFVVPAPVPAPVPALSLPSAPPTTTTPTTNPHSLPLSPDRPIYYAAPATAPPWRLIGHLHGICYPPSYSCGKWLVAATSAGILVCPTGNARCGDSPVGPPSWEAASWEELVAIMDTDLERSIAKVDVATHGGPRREGAVLTGFSRGAYAAPVIARRHPGRWPFLVLIEANVPLTAASLRKAGVRAVALVAGERGTEIAGERKTAETLAQDGFPVKLIVMPKVAHLYADDMDAIMADALSFVLAHESDVP